MTNIKKIGLTALAGTLASFSANAGEVSVSGVAQMTFSTDSDATSSTLVNTTDKFETNSSLTFWFRGIRQWFWCKYCVKPNWWCSNI